MKDEAASWHFLASPKDSLVRTPHFFYPHHSLIHFSSTNLSLYNHCLRNRLNQPIEIYLLYIKILTQVWMYLEGHSVLVQEMLCRSCIGALNSSEP